MDMMELRRSLLGGNPLAGYGSIEIVSKLFVPADTAQITFPFRGAGNYFVLPFQMISRAEAIASGNAYVFASSVFCYAETSNGFINGTTSSFNSSGNLGYWPCGVSFTDETKTEIQFKSNSSRNVILLGGRYYFVIKQAIVD